MIRLFRKYLCSRRGHGVIEYRPSGYVTLQGDKIYDQFCMCCGAAVDDTLDRRWDLVEKQWLKENNKI